VFSRVTKVRLRSGKLDSFSTYVLYCDVSVFSDRTKNKMLLYYAFPEVLKKIDIDRQIEKLLITQYLVDIASI